MEKSCPRFSAAKIRTGKGARAKIFSRPLRKNTARPLTVWTGGTDIERGLFSVERCAILISDKSSFKRIRICIYCRKEIAS